MQSRPAALVAGLCLIAGAAYAPVAVARQTTAARADTKGYSSDERDFTVGRSVYLRSTKTRIGRIMAMDANHDFPATFRKRHGKAVLIKRFDGPLDWTPVDGLSRIYVVR